MRQHRGIGGLILAVAALLLLAATAYGAADSHTILNVKLAATDMERDQGYFPFGAPGDQQMLVVKQGSELHHWLSSRNGTTIMITLEKVQ